MGTPLAPLQVRDETRQTARLLNRLRTDRFDPVVVQPMAHTTKQTNTQRIIAKFFKLITSPVQPRTTEADKPNTLISKNNEAIAPRSRRRLLDTGRDPGSSQFEGKEVYLSVDKRQIG